MMQVTDQETRQLQAMQNLPQDMVLLKMENEQIFAVAKATPRDPLKIVAQLQQLIDSYPAAADEAIYSKPVGTVMEVTCGDCKVKYEATKVETDTACPSCDSTRHAAIRKVKKFAEGLSIRAAESIRSIYGYTRLATTTELLDNGNAKLTGVLVDYAAGNITSDERLISPMYKSRGGQMVRTPDDRFLGVVVKAEKSKLRRDVILDNTPNIIKAMFRDACEKKLLELIAPEVIDQKVVPAFAAYGVTLEHLEKIVGRPRALGWRESERMELRKILAGLKNEEMTVRELLDGLELDTAGQRPSTVPDSGASIDDLARPQTKPEASSATAGDIGPSNPQVTPAAPSNSAVTAAPSQVITAADLIAEYRQRAAACDTIKATNALITAAMNDSRINDHHQESASFIGEIITGRQAVLRQQKKQTNMA
jgi:hypothetical protein